MQTMQACLSELQELSSASTSESRRAVLRRLTDLFVMSAELQSESDSSVFGDVVGRVAYDVDTEARAELSKRIAKRPNTPRNLALRLANDTIAVAEPVLEHATALTSEDLVSVVHSQGQEHSLAIAKRPTLASPVTDVLSEKGNEVVLTTLARNHGAEFSRTGLETLVTRADTNLEINEAVGERQDVPEDLRGQVRGNVKRGFEQQVGDVGELSLEDIAGQALGLFAADSLDPDASKFRHQIDHLHKHGSLSEETVGRFAKAKDKLSAAYAISKLAGLEPRLIGGILVRGTSFAIAIVAKASGFTRQTLDNLIELFKSGGTFEPEAIKEARSLHMVVDRQTAQKILRFLKVRMTLEQAG